MSVWRNWIAHQTSNLGVMGSSPIMDILTQIPERSKGVDSRSTALLLRGFESHFVYFKRLYDYYNNVVAIGLGSIPRDAKPC